jgi:hypothetical protein
MRGGLFAPDAAVADKPMVASSFAGGRWAATIDATGTRFVQLHGAAIDETCDVVPETVTLFGSAWTDEAFSFTATAAVTFGAPPRNKFPRIVAGDDTFQLPGVVKSPPIVTVFDHTS